MRLFNELQAMRTERRSYSIVREFFAGPCMGRFPIISYSDSGRDFELERMYRQDREFQEGMDAALRRALEYPI